MGFFEIAELTEVMRQQGENNFFNLLNHVRTADLDDYNVSILNSIFFLPNESCKKMLSTFSQKIPQQIFTISIF